MFANYSQFTQTEAGYHQCLDTVRSIEGMMSSEGQKLMKI